MRRLMWALIAVGMVTAISARAERDYFSAGKLNGLGAGKGGNLGAGLGANGACDLPGGNRGAQGPNVAPPPKKRVVSRDGADIFNETCMSCHGGDKFTLSYGNRLFSTQQMISSIIGGKMPKDFALDSAQKNALIEFIQPKQQL